MLQERQGGLLNHGVVHQKCVSNLHDEKVLCTGQPCFFDGHDEVVLPCHARIPLRGLHNKKDRRGTLAPAASMFGPHSHCPKPAQSSFHSPAIGGMK